MEYSNDVNTHKLYKIMEEKGYDVHPRDIINIYPAGYLSSKEKISKKPE